MPTHIHPCVCLRCVCVYLLILSYLSEQQPRKSVQVSHVRVVAEDAIDPLLLVGEDVVQLLLQLRRLSRRPLGWGRGRRRGGTARRMPFGGPGVGPVRGGVGHQGCGGPCSRVRSLDINRLLLLRGRPEVRGSQRGRRAWSPPDRKRHSVRGSNGGQKPRERFSTLKSTHQMSLRRKTSR